MSKAITRNDLDQSEFHKYRETTLTLAKRRIRKAQGRSLPTALLYRGKGTK